MNASKSQDIKQLFEELRKSHSLVKTNFHACIEELHIGDVENCSYKVD